MFKKVLSDCRIDINVPFSEKERVKAFGARWDATKKSWYIPPGISLESFHPWLSGDLKIKSEEITCLEEKNQGISLSVFLSKITQTVIQAFPKSEWIKCEISSVKHKAENTFIEVVEYDGNRHLLGKAYACIWQTNRALLEKFYAETGGALQADIKVLLLCKVSFQPKYGLSLIIEDIDPAYTLGDMAAKLEKIRYVLKQEGIFENNKKLPLPTDFFRVAVIAPKEAAGLGDFQQEANQLTHHKLCDFHYFYATFQGLEASVSLYEALKQVYQSHSTLSFDALVIIRGGGSTTDLAWLNDETLARTLCCSPLPVYTGIGHERDNTILDEIASVCLGTPSKVIHHIVSIINQKAQQALNDIYFIQQTVQNILLVKREQIEKTLDQSFHASQAQFQSFKADVENNYVFIISNIPHGLKMFHERCNENYALINHFSKRNLRETRNQINDLQQIIFAEVQASLKKSEENLEQHIKQIAEKSQNTCLFVKISIENLIKEIIGFGPGTILQRGYTMVSSKDGKIITSKKTALTHETLKLTFKDGSIFVIDPKAHEEKI